MQDGEITLDTNRKGDMLFIDQHNEDYPYFPGAPIRICLTEEQVNKVIEFWGKRMERIVEHEAFVERMKIQFRKKKEEQNGKP
jgi:hypothetical protein